MKSLRIFCLAACATLALLGTASAQSEAPTVTAQADSTQVSVDEIVDGLQKFYNDSKTFQAEFSQVYEEINGVERTSSGLVYFKKPGKMRWDYPKADKQDEKYLISDGKTFWAWEPGFKQYCRQSMADVALPSALTFLGGEGDIRKDFDVKLVDARDGRYLIELKPKTPNPNYTVLEFVVNQKNFRVDSVVIWDALGNQNRLYFKKQKFDEAQDDANFAFSPPADATHMCGDSNSGPATKGK